MRGDDASKEAVRVGNLSLQHTARKADREGDRQWYVADLWLDGPEDLRREAKKVTYQLHPTFRPSEVARTDAPDFRLSLRVWGEFTVRARVEFSDGMVISLSRYLSLPE